MFIKQFIQSLFLGTRLLYALAVLVCCFTCSFFLPWLLPISYVLFICLIMAILVDIAKLYAPNAQISAERIMTERLSNGDDNPIVIAIKSSFSIPLAITMWEELPFQLQKRDAFFKTTLAAFEHKNMHYTIRPVKRGEYAFGKVIIMAGSSLQLIKRRFKLANEQTVAVYPSFIQLRKYQLMALANNQSFAGIRKIRRFGHSMEFEQIKEYVPGDDYRTLNWQATARKGSLMVNTYSDEKSQHIYCLIDKSRVMQMPFDGLSLLDYAINATLVLSNIALSKQDKAGLISFSEKMGSFIKAEKREGQMQMLLEALYAQKTRYLESNYEHLYALVKRKITQRSLLVLFTNFESLSAMHRQLPYLKYLAGSHLLLVVFFENTELSVINHQNTLSVKQAYEKVVAEQFMLEKQLIVRELAQYGIMSILTRPADLTVNTLNKYLEIKARNLL